MSFFSQWWKQSIWLVSGSQSLTVSASTHSIDGSKLLSADSNDPRLPNLSTCEQGLALFLMGQEGHAFNSSLLPLFEHAWKLLEWRMELLIDLQPTEASELQLQTVGSVLSLPLIKVLQGIRRGAGWEGVRTLDESSP